MLGYWNQPEATAAVLDPAGWLRTGDQVHIDEQLHVFITGRLKEIIVLANGEKVPPADMELAITNDELLSQALIVGEGRPYLTALVVLDPDAYLRLAEAEGLNPELTAERLNPRLEELLLERIGRRLSRFPGSAIIHRVAVVEKPWSIDNDTMTPTMKLKRARILSRMAEDVNRLYEGHA
jgi:long-chain acyl-CoA synthetase